MTRRSWQNAFFNLLFPEKYSCLFCMRKSPQTQDMGICHRCVEKILEISLTQETCPFCGYFVGDNDCPNCCSWLNIYLQVSSVVPYEGMFRELIHDLKYNGRKELARPMGYLMACRLQKLPSIRKIRAIVPVPLSLSRQSERGYNQSLLLAEAIAEELGKPLWSEILAREHFHQPQMVLSREERMNNMQGAFKYAGEGKLAGSTILLVDDIITTGATLLACADVLRQAGANLVYGVTWAAGYDAKLIEKYKFKL